MMRVFLVVLLLPAITPPSRAGLGETLEQSAQRYGPQIAVSQTPHLPQIEPGTLHEFFKDGFKIQERFVGGKCAWILYAREDRPIYDTEIRTLLENNAEGSTWSQGTDKPDRFLKKQVVFTRADNLADAKYEELRTYHGLCIITQAWRRAVSPTSGL